VLIYLESCNVMFNKHDSLQFDMKLSLLTYKT